MSKKIVFLFALLLVSSVYGNIDVLEYSTSQNNDIILDKMKNITLQLENLGYDSERLNDIYEQTENVKDSDEFYNWAADFREVTILIRNRVREYNDVRTRMSILHEHNISVSELNDTLFEAEQDLINGRYEDAQTQLEIAELSINDKSGVLYQESLQKLESLKEISGNLEKTHLEDIRKRIIIARDLDDMVSLDNLLDDLEEVEIALDRIKEIETYIGYFESRDIDAKRLDDIKSQMEFLYESERFNDINPLYKEAKRIYDDSVEVQKEYRETRKEVEKINEEKFNASLQLAHQNYLEGDFEAASQQLSELNNEIIDYKSSRVALGNLRSNTINLWNLVKENWQYVIGSLVILAIISLLVSKSVKKKLQKKRIENLKKEKGNLERLMKEIQEQYYVKHDLSRKAYEQKFKQFQKRFVEVTKELDILEEQ